MVESAMDSGMREAEDLYKRGKELEDLQEFEKASHLYKDSTMKFINLLKMETSEEKKNLIKEMAEIPLTRARILKVKKGEMREESKQMEITKVSTRSSHIVYTTFTSELYEKTGEAFYNKLKDKKSLLSATIQAYIISASNLNQAKPLLLQNLFQNLQ
jgi:hypothetical protein